MASTDSPAPESQLETAMMSADDTAKGTKRKREDSDMICQWQYQTNVLVGPEEQPFPVHTHILRKIPFFRGSLDAEMREKHEGVVRMPEDDANVFALIVHWAYDHELAFDIHRIRADAASKGASNQMVRVFWEKFALVLKLYFMASKLMIEELQNHIVDVILKLNSNVLFGWHHHRAVVDNTTQDEPMRLLMMQHLSWDIFRQGGWRAWKSQAPNLVTRIDEGSEYTDFIAEALTTFPNSKRPSSVADEPCKWHIHTSTPKCNE